jgi:hypothetical protein
MGSSDYNKGLSGEIWTGSGSLADWQRGYYDGGHNNPTGGGGNGSLGCITILFGILFIFIAIPALIAALLSGFVLTILIGIIRNSFSIVSFQHIIGKLFWVCITYIAGAIILSIIFHLFNTHYLHDYPGCYKLGYFLSLFWITFKLNYSIIFHAILILISALICKLKFQNYLFHSKVYIKSILISALLILPSIYISLLIVTYFIAKYIPLIGSGIFNNDLFCM